MHHIGAPGGRSTMPKKMRALQVPHRMGSLEVVQRDVHHVFSSFAAATLAGTVAACVAPGPGKVVGEPSPIYGVTIPPGYRDWKVIAVDQLLVPGGTDQLRAQLGNEIAIKTFKEGRLPFPDGAIVAAIHWTRVPSGDNDNVLASEFPGAQSFVIGSTVNIQLMVKDSKKYAASGGWGFADFKDGKPASEALHSACFACHMPAKDRDYVFTHYAD
jgi:hypothetical protein